MRLRRGGWCSGATLGVALGMLATPTMRTGLGSPFQKPKKEEQTQVLQVPKELPGAVEGDSRRLTFYVTPLSGKGLLSQQIRDAVKALEHRAGGDTILKIRAFVAGPGDVRRVRDLISGLFTERQKPLPALSLIRCGALPLDGAQVVLEAIAQTRKPANPYGLAFLSAQVATSESSLDPVEPLMAKVMAGVKKRVAAVGATSSDVVRVTCFLSSLQNLAASRQLVEGEYGHAAVDYVQAQRSPGRGMAACEVVARLTGDPGAPLKVTAGEGALAGESDTALVGAAQVVLTGGQVSFGFEAKDAHLAFARLDKELAQVGTSLKKAAFVHYYPVAPPIAAQVRLVRQEFLDAARPPAGSMLVFEGLTSLDAGFALDVVAVK